MAPNEIQRKHRREREEVVSDALQSSMNHLARANRSFDTAIPNSELRQEFFEKIRHAQTIIAELGIER